MFFFFVVQSSEGLIMEETPAETSSSQTAQVLADLNNTVVSTFGVSQTFVEVFVRLSI